MHESSVRSPKHLGKTRISSNGFSARGSHPANRWLAILLTATGAIYGGSALAVEPALQPLAWFAGTWQCAGKFESNGKPIEAHLRFDWNETALVMVKHHDDQPPNQYHAVELWGAARTGLTAAIVDAYSGTRVFTSAGWTNEALSWTRTIDAKPVERFVYVRDSEDRMRVDWATSKDGLAFKVGDTLSCERQKTESTLGVLSDAQRLAYHQRNSAPRDDGAARRPREKCLKREGKSVNIASRGGIKAAWGEDRRGL